jgi:hypothetical protein
MENKTGKYLKYAVGEIVLVMIGILLALQVNNWNSNRIEKKKEANYIENINKQFKLNRAQLDVVTLGHQKVHTNATKIINLVPIDVDKVNKDSLSFYITETFYNYTFNPQQSTIDALTNTSDFEIISNLELRGLLQKWKELVKDYQEEEISFQRYFLDSYIPYFKNHISLLNYTKNTNIFDDSNVEFTFLNSLEFQNMMVLQKRFVSNIIFETEFNEVNKTIDRIIELTSSEK